MPGPAVSTPTTSGTPRNEILAAASIFGFITAWNNYLWPFIITTDPALMTLPVGIPNVLDFYGSFYAAQMASSMVAAAPIVTVFLLFQRRIVGSVATTGLRRPVTTRPPAR